MRYLVDVDAGIVLKFSAVVIWGSLATIYSLRIPVLILATSSSLMMVRLGYCSAPMPAVFAN